MYDAQLPKLISAPVGECPKVRFSRGYETGRMKPKDPWKQFVGWTSEIGKFLDIDEILESLGTEDGGRRGWRRRE
jgi:hypothetical protein